MRNKGYRDASLIAKAGTMLDSTYLKNMKIYGAREVAGLVPEALDALKQSLKSKNPEVKRKTAVQVLENADILGPTKFDFTINDLKSKNESELRAILEQAKKVPMQTIEEDSAE